MTFLSAGANTLDEVFFLPRFVSLLIYFAFTFMEYTNSVVKFNILRLLPQHNIYSPPPLGAIFRLSIRSTSSFLFPAPPGFVKACRA